MQSHDVLSALKRKIVLAFYLFVAVLLVGTLGFMVLGGGRYSMLECLYMTVITVTTVGYGEVVDLSKSPAGRIFDILLIFAGMGVIVYFVTNVTAFLIEGNLKEVFRRRKMEKYIERLSGHYIVCGAGSIGAHVAQEFVRTGRKVVVIDLDATRLEQFEELEAGTLPGDATEAEVLKKAGIERAAGLVAATDSDKDNLVLTIMAKQLNPALRVVARCSAIKHQESLKQAGADSVVSSNYIGGLRMASEMVRPEVVTFLDMMLRDSEQGLRIEEALVTEGSALAGKPASEAKRHALVLAIMRADGTYQFNPPDDYPLEPGTTVIFMGNPAERDRLTAL